MTQALASPLPRRAARRLVSSFGAITIAGSLLVSCADSSETWISIVGLPDAEWPPESLVLEVGSQAWILEPGRGDGVVKVVTTTALPARVLWADDCSQIAAFTVEPNGRYLVRFSADDTATVRRTETTNLGPGLSEPRGSPCG